MTHEWYIVTGHSRLIYASCLEPDCEAELDETEMTRRLNATERLNADQAKFMAIDGNGKLLKSDVYRLMKYASALEGDV